MYNNNEQYKCIFILFNCEDNVIKIYIMIRYTFHKDVRFSWKIKISHHDAGKKKDGMNKGNESNGKNYSLPSFRSILLFPSIVAHFVNSIILYSLIK